jgi:hypothetical protein
VQPSHVVEGTSVGRQIGARGPTDRLLVHDHQPFQAIESFSDFADRGLNRGAFKGAFVVIVRHMRLTKMPAQRLDEKLADEADLPEPDTPVTVVNTPNGNATSIALRLLRVTPLSLSHPCGVRSFCWGGVA